MDDAVKFHVKFEILFARLSPNSKRQACSLSNHTCSPTYCHPFYFCSG